jgi:hypothetical protein
MPKPHVTRTYGPIHFEDLDPKRFEDLVRELIYDFRDWQSIEATGKSGSDDGIDIRAYERIFKTVEIEEETGDEMAMSPMNGNWWQIQCKRHADLGPKKIKEIIDSDIDINNIPFGYILVASSNFSKKSYDVFRSELAKKGILEFYLWGKAELEDMLYLPKNDRILFTFFGISLTSKRRVKTTERKIFVGNKNKLFKILGTEPSFMTKILIRDINDSMYPHQSKYPDFKKFPRWNELEMTQYSVSGIFVLVHEYFAFINERAKNWDYTNAYDFIYLEDKTIQSECDPNYYRKPNEKITSFWESLPIKNQAKYKIWGLLRYEDMLLIDEKGDHVYESPHIYIDFKPQNGPFYRFLDIIESGGSGFEIDESEFKRVKIFPDSFPDPREGEIHRDKKIVLDETSLKSFQYGHQGFNTIYYAGDAYDFLDKNDIIAIENPSKDEYYNSIKITSIIKRPAGEIIDSAENSEYIKLDLARQVGQNINPFEIITILEFKRVSDDLS